MRAVVKEASSQKEALVAQATKTEDWNWLREQLEENEKQFKEKLKAALSSDDIKTLEKMAEETSRMMPGRSGRSRR